MKLHKPGAGARYISELFSEKIFRVPNYQRTYAWEKQNWEDFWNDIKEGLQTQTPHYWGTITLRNTGKSKYDKNSATEFTIYEVVDGQQRLTTIYLFFLTLSEAGQQAIRDKFVKRGNIYRIELGSLNKQFLKDIVDGKESSADLDFKTNRLLRDGLEYFENQLKAYLEGRADIDELTKYFLSNTLSLEFQVQDENMAIRAFQSLNDRGKDLTLLDKTKSFLMFYSSRYLEDELNNNINRSLGDIFKNYDLIEERGRKANIAYITNPRYRFSEDELLRFFYHYFARYAINKYPLGNMGYDYTTTTKNVFKRFIKPSCNLLKDERELLSQFIDDFLRNFVKFTESFKDLVDNAEDNSPYRKLFSFLGLSATVYPLIISLKAENLIDDRLLMMTENLDLRVYKVRGTNPRASLYKKTISKIKGETTSNATYEGIQTFIEDFMRDPEFQIYLYRDMHRNPAVKYVLWEFEKDQTSSFNGWDRAFYDNLQVEHIFPREPTFGFPAYGFQDQESDYRDNIHKLGNLTLLEEPINKGIGNKTPQDKASDYQESKIPGTKKT